MSSTHPAEKPPELLKSPFGFPLPLAKGHAVNIVTSPPLIQTQRERANTPADKVHRCSTISARQVNTASDNHAEKSRGAHVNVGDVNVRQLLRRRVLPSTSFQPPRRPPRLPACYRYVFSRCLNALLCHG